MPEYTVVVQEVHIQRVKITADSPDDARMKVQKGEGEEQGESEYSYTIDSDDWAVRLDETAGEGEI